MTQRSLKHTHLHMHVDPGFVINFEYASVLLNFFFVLLCRFPLPVLQWRGLLLWIGWGGHRQAERLLWETLMDRFSFMMLERWEPLKRLYCKNWLCFCTLVVFRLQGVEEALRSRYDYYLVRFLHLAVKKKKQLSLSLHAVFIHVMWLTHGCS